MDGHGLAVGSRLRGNRLSTSRLRSMLRGSMLRGSRLRGSRLGAVGWGPSEHSRARWKGAGRSRGH